MPGPPLIVIGASAGGIEALAQLIPKLPASLPAAVAVVVHRQPVSDDDRLARVLSRGANLPIFEPANGETIVAGRMYVAPANIHLAVEDGRLRYDGGPRENASRPSIDVLFRTAASARGRSVIGVLLSGSLYDGTAGMAAIQSHGGRTIVQDPRDAQFADMPRNVLQTMDVDAVLPAAQIAPQICRFVSDLNEAGAAAEPVETVEVPTRFVCPDCGGVLSESTTGDVRTYRCHTGHAYSESGLLLKQDEQVENAMWSAVRVLEERAELCERVSRRLSQRSHDVSAKHMERQALRARRHADALRSVLANQGERLEAARDQRLAEEAGGG
jgi:two-component system chemotaxis response regulator CheB